jgi:hypothetical protein
MIVYQHSDRQQDDQDRQEPELLAHAHEAPEFSEQSVLCHFSSDRP